MMTPRDQEPELYRALDHYMNRLVPHVQPGTLVYEQMTALFIAGWRARADYAAAEARGSQAGAADGEG